MNSKKKIVWISGIMSLIIVGASVWLISKVAHGFYASNSDWLVIGLLTWLVMIHWFTAYDSDVNEK